MAYSVVLFGLTGLGSQMLQYLLDLGLDVRHVFTRREPREHPYFPVRPVEDIAARHAIACSLERPRRLPGPVDLVLCATYHRLLGPELLSGARLGAYNFHPGLLPAYRGATPTKQCLLNGDAVSGMTVHAMTERMDEGAVVAQRRLAIEDYFDDGLLRQHLSALQYPLLLDLLAWLDGPRDLPPAAGDGAGRTCPPVGPIAATWRPDLPVAGLCRQVRASSPFPGLTLTVNGRTFRATKFVSFCPAAGEGAVQAEGGTLVIRGPDGTLTVVGEEA